MTAIDKKRQATILVIDDDEGIRDAIKEGLELSEFQLKILTAPSAAKGLQVTKSEYPDVIILDMNMPLGDGLQVVDNIRKDRSLKDVKILMLTALDNRKMMWDGYDHGIDDFMGKPFDLVELEGRVYGLLTKSNRRSVT